MARRLMIIASALVLGLTTLTVARADERDQRYAVPYSSYSDSRVAPLAREVDDIATRIYREYARNNRRPDREERAVLDRLNELSDRADRFSDGARDGRYDSRNDRYDRYDRYDRRSSRVDDRDYRALVDAFYRTENALRYIQRRPYVDDGMDRIASRLRELSRYYGGYDQFDRYDRYDRNDNGRHNGWYRQQ